MAHGNVSTGVNSRPLGETVSETGPGIPDAPVGDGELAPGALDKGAERAVRALRESGWAPSSASAAAEVQDAEAEAEAHPS